MTPRLVLFDIDGTLLHSHGAGRRSMEAALVDAFGTKGAADYRYDGKTDRQIVRDLMRGEGFEDAVIDARMPALMEAYVANLEREIVVTDTLPIDREVWPEVRVVSVAPLLAEVIRRLVRGRSLRDMN